MTDKLPHVITAQAPVNIALIKYWGKSDTKFKIPINDSLSATLSTDEMCTTTSVYISGSNGHDKLILNGEEQNLSSESPAKVMLDDIRKLSPLNSQLVSSKVFIVSNNNFPTAAGLASSAAGYACLAYSLGHAFGVTDASVLSKIARKGSGSACRSLFGGFVHWEKGCDHQSSSAKQLVDAEHWSEMRVVICVVNDRQKEVPSSQGMALSVKTSPLIKYRAEEVVPARIKAMQQAILSKNFDEFAQITMQDSNEFHAICLDTFPPIFYLNDTSRQIIKICSIINSFYGHNKVAYTFDAGPNACIYLLDEFVDTFIEVIKHFFPSKDKSDKLSNIEIRGRPHNPSDRKEAKVLIDHLSSESVMVRPKELNYIINTSLGSGPKLVDQHIGTPQK